MQILMVAYPRIRRGNYSTGTMDTVYMRSSNCRCVIAGRQYCRAWTGSADDEAAVEIAKRNLMTDSKSRRTELRRNRFVFRRRSGRDATTLSPTRRRIAQTRIGNGKPRTRSKTINHRQYSRVLCFVTKVLINILIVGRNDDRNAYKASKTSNGK